VTRKGTQAVRFSFPRQARLTRATEFEAVYREGEQVNVFPLRVRALRRTGEAGQTRDAPAPGACSRLGLCVSRRAGSAQVRNRWKAAVREAFRLHRHRLPAAYDMVVSVVWEGTEQDARLVEQAFLGVVDILCGRQRRGADPRGPSS